MIETVEPRTLLSASFVGTFTNAPAPPANMASGELATASYTIKNTGSTAAVPEDLVFLLDTAPTASQGSSIDLYVNSSGISTSSPIGAGKTATETLVFTLPQDLSGTYYILGEFSISNYFASAPINVNGQTPNLALSFSASSVPATTSFGSTIDPQLQVANTGTANASGQELTYYFLSTSNDPNQDLGTDVSGVYYLNSESEAVNLDPGQSLTETPGLTLPNTAAIPPGTYYLVAEGNEGTPPIADPSTNNPVAVSAPITITAAAAGAASALVPTLPHTTLPASLVTGKSTPATATVLLQNSGSSVYSGSTHVTLYLSQSQTLDSTATPVSGVVRTLRVPAHKSVSLVVRLGAVPSVANGSYYLLAQVTDSSGATNSVATSQTVQVAAPFVALAASLGAPPVNVLKTGMTLAVENSGNITDSGVLDYTIGFSSDAQGAAGVGTSYQSKTARVAIGAGKTVKVHVTGWSKLISGLSAGQYYLTVFVEDSTGNTSLAVSPVEVTVA